MMSEGYKQLVKDSVLGEDAFISVTFSGQRRRHVVPWRKVVVRPVLIKNKRHVQFSYFDAQKDITKNYTGAEIIAKLDALLALPFASISLQTTRGDVHVQITKKGKAVIHERAAPEERQAPSLEHDRRKASPIPADQPEPFLRMIGIMTEKGTVRANMRKKFRQINQFLGLMIETGELEQFAQSSLNIVDCGCGNAYLTFAVYHYLDHTLGAQPHLTGIDVKEDLIKKRAEQSRALGWDNLTFQTTSIIDFQPIVPPDIVLALHACDTATDEALAQAVKWGSKMIFSAPCCHHHLQRQLAQQPTPPPFDPVLQHGILRERLGDILTDAFRAAILRIMGYRADVVEFVSAEHTDKNLMIRAIKAGEPGDPQAMRVYKDLKAFWQVTPYLEPLLEEEMLTLDRGLRV